MRQLCMGKDEVKQVKKALLKKCRTDYEKVRTLLTKKYGYKKFRDIQNQAFRELNNG